MTDAPQVVVVEQKSGTGCVTGCLALIGLLVVLAFVLPMCGLVSLGTLFTSDSPNPATPSPAPSATPQFVGGARIITCDRDGKAFAAGLRAGDVIVQYAQEPITSVRNLEVQIGWHDSFPRNKDPIRLTYIRDGRTLVTYVAAGKLGVTVLDEN